MKKIIRKIEKIKEEIEAIAYEIEDKRQLKGFVETEEQEQFYKLTSTAFDGIWGAITVLDGVAEYLLTASQYDENNDENNDEEEDEYYD